jgi:hypothetical protein
MPSACLPTSASGASRCSSTDAIRPSASACTSSRRSTRPRPATAPARDKILCYVLGVRFYGTFWTDKWHPSPYNPTSRALIVLLSHVPDYVDAAVDQLLAKQHASGTWEHYAPTAEETALTLHALLEYHREVRRLPQEPLHRPARYLIVEGGTFQVHYPRCGSPFSAPSDRSATPSTETSPREASGVARGVPGLAASGLKLEITETTVMEDEQHVIGVLRQAMLRGCLLRPVPMAGSRLLRSVLDERPDAKNRYPGTRSMGRRSALSLSLRCRSKFSLGAGQSAYEDSPLD